MTNALLALLLLAFWALLSGYYTPLLLSLGVASALLVTWLKMRMDKTDGYYIRIRPSLSLIRYFVWLYGQVIIANIAVSKRILSLKLDIQPTWEPLSTDLKNDVEMAFLASSITLTPDTFTTNINNKDLMIHSLWPESYENLKSGEMETRLKKIGIS